MNEELMLGSMLGGMPLSEWLERIEVLVVDYGFRIVLALAIFFGGRWVARLLSRVIEKSLTRRGLDLTVGRFLANLVYGAGIAFALVAALAQTGIQTASFVAVIGAAGLAVGLALQGSLANFAAGVLMVTLRPCRVGDFIEAAGVAGLVHEISLFTTTIKTGDNKTIIVPNGDILNRNIVNYTREPLRRIDLLIGVSYRADLRAAQRVLQAVVDAEPRVLKDPAPAVAVRELGDSAVKFIVRPWVKTEDYWAVHDALLAEIKTRLDAEGIGIPFPQMDVHLHTVNH